MEKMNEPEAVAMFAGQEAQTSKKLIRICTVEDEESKSYPQPEKLN